MSKMIKCKNCEEKYSNELTRCPFCNTLSPLSSLKVYATILVVSILVIVIIGIVLGFTKKDNTGGEPKPSTSDGGQNITSIELENEDGTIQSDSEQESANNEITESKTESADNNPSSNETKKDNQSTVSKPQEQQPINQIPQNETNGVKTADINLPSFFDATEGLKHCRDWYRPLSFIVLTSGMDEIVNDYNAQFNDDYILDVGGNGIDKVMRYTYRIRFDFYDVSGAKAKFEKHLNDNAEFFESQLALYKEYSPDVTGIEVIFEHDESNQTLTSRIFK